MPDTHAHPSCRPWIPMLAAGAIASTLLGGCASHPGVIFDPANAAHRWPPPPDEARIQYLGQLRSEDDLKAGRSGFQRLGDAIFGREAAAPMVSPLGVCTDGGDRVYVADSNGLVVHALDLKTRSYQRLAPPAETLRFVQPVAVVCDPAGRVLVADSAAGHLVAFDRAGVFLGTLGRGLLQRPCGLAIDAARGRIYVADAGAHQIVVLNMDGTEADRIGQRGSGAGEFNYPTAVALDRAGRLYVSDSLNFRVQVFDPAYKHLRSIGRKGDMPGYFSQPKGLFLDAEDHLYVVDGNFEAVQLFDTDGRLLMTFGHEGSGPGEFWLPVGIYVDLQNRVWVADSYNRRVQVFEYLAEGGKGKAP